jgi:hypothetical protein
MAKIDDYVQNIDRARIDAVTDPIFSRFLTPADKEVIPITLPNGTQSQVQALSLDAIKRVIDKIVQRAQTAGLDLKTAICAPAPDGFDLCEKLKTTTAGQLMRELDAFLKNRWAEGGVITAGVIGVFTGLSLPTLGPFVAIFTAVGFLNKAFVELCECQK